MLTKIKNALFGFWGNVKKICINIGSKCQNIYKSFTGFIKKAALDFWSYMKSLDIRVVIALGVMLVIIIALMIMVITHSFEGQKVSGDNSVVEFSSNYEGNLINIYSDELSLTPYGVMAYSNDGANKKSLELKDGYLEMSRPFNLSKEFTFQTWIKIKDTSIVNPIIFGRASSSGDVHNGPVTIKFFDEYRTILCDITFINANGEYVSQSFATDRFIDTEALKNIWHHIAVTLDKNNYSLYFDGTLVNVIPMPENLFEFKEIASNKNPFFIGIGENGYMKGQIDETRIFSYILSAEEIKEEYEKAHPVKTHRIVMKSDSRDAALNGEAVTLDANVLKDRQNESYLVPLKSVIESIGGTFTPDENEKDKFDISFKNKTVSLWLMDTNAVTDGNHTKLDFYPREFDGVVYVPVLMFSKLYNLDVSATNESIIINY